MREPRERDPVETGAAEGTKDGRRRAYGPRIIDECGQDLRYAFRGLRRQPGFVLAATLTLTLGLGLAVGLFAVVDAVLLQPLPFPDQDELVVLWEKDDSTGNVNDPACARQSSKFGSDTSPIATNDTRPPSG